MKRYYSHYTFIYPDIYLKNHVVELDDDDKLIRYFLFDKEIERTEFYSGWLVFVEKKNIVSEVLLIEEIKKIVSEKYSELITDEYFRDLHIIGIKNNLPF